MGAAQIFILGLNTPNKLTAIFIIIPITIVKNAFFCKLSAWIIDVSGTEKPANKAAMPYNAIKLT